MSSRIESLTWGQGASARSIHIEDAGDGEPVVLLHSSGMSGDQWRRTVDLLQRRGLRTIVPHLLGSGRSSAWPETEPFSYTFDADLVGVLLVAIGEPVHFVGHSYGGLLALLASLTAPSSVRSIAVYDPVAFGVLDRARDAEAFANLDTLAFEWGTSAAQHEAWLRGFVDYWGGAGAWSNLREGARAEMSRVGWVAHEGARTLIGDPTRAPAYAALRVPTLLVTGEHTPSAAARVVERLGGAIPGAHVERIAGAGHMGPLTVSLRQASVTNPAGLV